MSRITSAGLFSECSTWMLEHIFLFGIFFYKWNREFRWACRDHDMDWQIAKTVPFSLKKLRYYFRDNWNFLVACMWFVIARTSDMNIFAKAMQLIEGVLAALIYFIAVMLFGWVSYFFGGKAIKEQFNE